MANERAQETSIASTFYSLAVMILIGFIAWVGRGVLIPVVVAIFLTFLIFTLKETVKQTPFIGKILPRLALFCTGIFIHWCGRHDLYRNRSI